MFSEVGREVLRRKGIAGVPRTRPTRYGTYGPRARRDASWRHQTDNDTGHPRIDPNGAGQLFEMPIVLPLPETLAFLP